MDRHELVLKDDPTFECSRFLPRGFGEFHVACVWMLWYSGLGEKPGAATKVLIVDLGDDGVENVSLSYRMHG